MVERSNALSNASQHATRASEMNAHAASAGSGTLTNLLSDNSTRFGLDTRSLAADISGLDKAERGTMLNALSERLNPVQMGEMMRALDQQGSKNAPRPADDIVNTITDIGSRVVDGARSAIDIIGGLVAGAIAGATKAADPLQIGAVLGADTAALAGRSPSLVADMRALEADGWTIAVGTAGGGSYASRDTKTITIDGNEIGNAAALTQTLAHEVGHARYTPGTDYSSREAYVRSALADEGAATLSNIRAQREIIANGGADIGIAGQSTNHAAYNAAYDEFVKTGDAVTARDAIGAIFGNGERTSTTGEKYADYYGGWYDRNFP